MTLLSPKYLNLTRQYHVKNAFFENSCVIFNHVSFICNKNVQESNAVCETV